MTFVHIPGLRGIQSRSIVATLICLVLTTWAIGGETMIPGKWISVSTAVKTNGLKAYGDGTVLGNCDDGDWAEFGPLDFSDGLVDRLEIQLASPKSGGRIGIYIDNPNGTLLGEVTIKETGGYSTYIAQQSHSEQIADKHSVFLVFKGGKNLCNVKAFRFLKPGQEGSKQSPTTSSTTPSGDLQKVIETILTANQKSIETNRTALITIQASPGATVSVKQARHQFEFGTAINRKAFMPNDKMGKADQDRYKEILLANFNSVVHENAMKWYSNEREPGKQTFEAADKMLEWAETNGLSTRGHCVYWGRDNLVPGWQKKMDNKALRAKLQERAKIYMTRYKGRISEHDINNEMVHCTYYKKRLGGEIWKQMFDWCHQYDPNAILYVNDYSILSGGDTGKYVKQIEGFLKAGMKVGGIGVQGHFGGKTIKPDDIKKKLDDLATFNLPIKVTEFDVNTTNEAAKAQTLATLYITAFAHPAVEGIYMWGFWKKSHWRPNAALWNADWSETPAAKAYRDLVFNRWWTNFEGKANDQGIATVRAFLGDHDITVNGKTHRFTITGPSSLKCQASDATTWTKDVTEK